MNFIDDLKSINDLTDDHLHLLLKEFNSNPILKIKEIASFETFCASNGIDLSLAKNFYSILSYTCAFCIENKSVVAGVSEIESSIISTHFEDVDRIWGFIKANINNLEEFILFRKERKLRSVCERLDSFNLICDARPLYDITRERVVRITYPILLSIETQSSPSKMVFEMDELELLELKQEVDTAIMKLGVLKQKFGNG